MAAGLTMRMTTALDFIRAYHAEHRIMPSYDEIAARLGLKSKSNIYRLIEALEERGHIITARPGGFGYRRARSMTLVVDPSNPIGPLCHHCGNPFGSAACLAAAAQNTTRIQREAA